VELSVRDISLECGRGDVLMTHEQLDRTHTHTLCIELNGKGPATCMRRLPYASLFVKAREQHT